MSEEHLIITNIINTVCVCFLPIHSGHQVRWTYQPGSHRREVQYKHQTRSSNTIVKSSVAYVILYKFELRAGERWE